MIVEFVASFIEAYLGIKVSGFIFPSKYDRKKEFALICIFSILISISIVYLNGIKLFSYFTLLIGAIEITISGMILYKSKYVVITTSFYMMCLTYLDVVTITIVGLILDNENHMRHIVNLDGTFMRYVQVIICKIVMVVAYIIAKRVFPKFIKKNTSLHYTGRMILILALSASGLIFLIKRTLDSVNVELAIDWLLFGILLTLTILVILLYANNKKEKETRKLIEIHNDLITERFDDLNKIYIMNSTLFHDTKHHFKLLYEFVLNKNYQELENYIKILVEKESEYVQKRWTGNQIVDIILNSKISDMNEKEIDYEINVEFPKTTSILSKDICIILSNLLDNAIEACEKCNNKKYIKVGMKRVNKMIILKIENTYVGNEEKFNFGFTTKKEKNLHGWGLKSVEETIKKYNGTLNYSKKMGQYQIIISLMDVIM